MKSFRGYTRVAVLLAIVLGLPGGLVGATNQFTVTQTFDAKPFTYQVRQIESRSGYQLLRISYPSPVVSPYPENNTVSAMLYLPEGLKPGARRPAVICLPILNGDETLSTTVCSVLVRRGIPALMFTLPYYHERASEQTRDALEENPKMFVTAIEQALADIRRAGDLLASRPEIDPQRLGVTGISLGGIMSATAAGLDSRFQRVGLMLAGGDLLTIINHTEETRELSTMLARLPSTERAMVQAKLRAIDPLTSAPALRERARQGRVLMINAADDEVIPPDCTRRLAAALEMTNRVVWFEGLGHYTAMAELPRALGLLGDFFAQDLPPGTEGVAAKKTLTPLQQAAAFVQQVVTILSVSPPTGRAHFLDAVLMTTNSAGDVTEAQTRLVMGSGGKFNLSCKLPKIGEVAMGQGKHSWLHGADGQAVFVGSRDFTTNVTMVSNLAPEHQMRFRVFAGAASALTLAPDIAQKWVVVEKDPDQPAGRALRISSRDPGGAPIRLRLLFAEDGETPTALEMDVAGTRGLLQFRRWQTNAFAPDEVFEPSGKRERREVSHADVCRMFSAVLNFAGEFAGNVPEQPPTGDGSALQVVSRDPAGHGLLCRQGNKTILMVEGTPAQMGAAHGVLLADSTRRMVERVLYGIGAVDTVSSGEWFPARLESIERRIQPHLPQRFFEECDAMADAAGISRRDARYSNLFPERFHCTGVALRGKATVGGQVLHARVLDYLRDIGLQRSAAVAVFLPQGKNKWMSLGYTGFIGTVTAMNERGLAIGEMGGGGVGQWDGVPMSFLLRDVMERAGTVEEAVKIIQASPRTCEYYYVVSDKSGELRALHCVPDKVTVLRPGEQHPDLPKVPEDVVFISGSDRAKVLSERLQEAYGNIDAQRLIEIIKRPVAMKSNLHNAIFAPQTLEMWFADAGKTTPACDEPYARVRLDELIRFYEAERGLGGGRASGERKEALER